MNRTVVMQIAIFLSPVLMLPVSGSLGALFFVMLLVSIYVLVRDALR